jgi:hypothetical protein
LPKLDVLKNAILKDLNYASVIYTQGKERFSGGNLFFSVSGIIANYSGIIGNYRFQAVNRGGNQKQEEEHT